MRGWCGAGGHWAKLNFLLSYLLIKYQSVALVSSNRNTLLSTSSLHNQDTHHINQLGELQLELDGDGVRDVDDGPHQLVVAGEQVVKQPLGVRITLSQH